MLGLSQGNPAALRWSCHLRLNARPASMMASEDPTVPAPTAGCPSSRGALNKCAIMFTHRSWAKMHQWAAGRKLMLEHFKTIWILTESTTRMSIHLSICLCFPVSFCCLLSMCPGKQFHLNFRSNGVLIHVDIILVQWFLNQLVALRLHPRCYERRQIQTGIAIQHQLIVYHLGGCILGCFVIRQPPSTTSKCQLVNSRRMHTK